MMSLPQAQENGATDRTTALAVDESSDERRKARLAMHELAEMISVPMALYAAVRLNVADVIWSDGANAPLTPGQILSRIAPATTTPAGAKNLLRILQLLSSYGVFNEHLCPGAAAPTIETRYSLTEVGKTLVTDEEGLSYGAFVLQHHQEPMMKAWPLVYTAVLDPSKEPFVRVNGESAYAYYERDEEMVKLMQRAMSGISVPFMKALVGSDYDGFDGVETLVDVAGSVGDCLRIILQKHSGIKKAINFDLPEVVAKAPQIPGITHVGGDMFESIPQADAIFTKFNLSQWTDDEVKHIMKNCYDALPIGGKLIACEPAMPEQSDGSQRTRTILASDLYCMNMYRVTGNHRSEDQYKQLGKLAGFTKFRAVNNIDYICTLFEFKK